MSSSSFSNTHHHHGALPLSRLWTTSVCSADFGRLPIILKETIFWVFVTLSWFMTRHSYRESILAEYFPSCITRPCSFSSSFLYNGLIFLISNSYSLFSLCVYCLFRCFSLRLALGGVALPVWMGHKDIIRYKLLDLLLLVGLQLL